MSYVCRKLSCMHEQDVKCAWRLGSYWCCKCDTKMYKSTIHTPASNCSAGTGVSGGPARSVLDQMDDFDVQLKEKLEASLDVTGNLGSKDAAERVAEKVAEWRRNMDALLDGEEGAMEEEGYVSGSGTGDEVDDEIGVGDDIKTKYRRNGESIKLMDKLKELASKEPLDKEKSNNQEEEQWRVNATTVI